MMRTTGRPKRFHLILKSLPLTLYRRIDFEDTYDGLGDQLDEADDDMNDATFGDGGSGPGAGIGGTGQPPDKDFDFFGSTNRVSDAFDEEGMRFQRNQGYTFAKNTAPASAAPKPYRTGYEGYKNASHIPDLQVDPSLWGASPASQAQPLMPSAAIPAQSSTTVSQKKMMSLEEVEAAMRVQPKKPTPGPAQETQYQLPQTQAQSQPLRTQPAPQVAEPPTYRYQVRQHEQSSYPQPSGPNSGRSRTVPQSSHQGERRPPAESRVELPAQANLTSQSNQIPQILQRAQPSDAQQIPQHHASQPPRQILQNPKRHSEQLDQGQMYHPDPSHQLQDNSTRGPPGTPGPLPIITHPSQLAALSEGQREAIMAAEARRAKRNHKIYQLSKGNGLMTPQDKNFITRIQLQQLMTATGNVNEPDPDVSLAEDFYYQVYNQIEHRPRQNPHQPLSNFAQTYLFQTGGRHGGMNRRHNRGDNHMHRMQQQVQRAVEAAKAKPKNKQLVIEGSLGKISFSNAKTPKPLLNLKGSEKLPQAALSTTDRKAILKNIEAVYTSLMKLEDHDRRVPQQPRDVQDPSSFDAPYQEWHQHFQQLNKRLWLDLKVWEPIIADSTTMHPFIAFLSYPKGKKAIPRIWAHIDLQQRLTILTIIMVKLDTLDVIRYAQPQLAASQSRSIAREQVDLFLHVVMPSLFSYVTEAPLSTIIGLVGLGMDRVNVPAIVRSQVGLEILTMLLSQAEIIHKAEAISKPEWTSWLEMYNRLFDTVEPLLGEIFPASVSAGKDVYAWQFLATMGTGANPEQQQRLVLAVK